MRALVAYGTKYGSTEKVAAEMASALRQKGAEVTVADLRRDKVRSLAGYDLVVVGSGIAMGQWSKGARKFLEEHAAELEGKRVALFACCIDVVLFPSKLEEHRRKYLVEVAAKHGIEHPVAMGLFGGEVDLGKYGFLDATMAKSYMRSDKVESREKVMDLSKPLDFHDWGAIEEWAASLAEV